MVHRANRLALSFDEQRNGGHDKLTGGFLNVALGVDQRTSDTVDEQVVDFVNTAGVVPQRRRFVGKLQWNSDRNRLGKHSWTQNALPL